MNGHVSLHPNRHDDVRLFERRFGPSLWVLGDNVDTLLCHRRDDAGLIWSASSESPE